MSDPKFVFKQGKSPLLISIPHLGRIIPPQYAARMTDVASQIADTDWHLEQVYAFADELGASVLAATHSRYVIDLNRPPNNESLYPGQTTTGLCPTETFRGEPLYLEGQAPTDADIQERLAGYWKPYHDKLEEEIQRIKAAHGGALLWEAHSIASVLPRLFDGKLPDLNIGTGAGSACSEDIVQAITSSLDDVSDFTWVVNGRFKGGHITRHYGRPAQNIHAVQLEMCQSTYMNETAPFDYRPDLSAQISPVVRKMVTAAVEKLQASLV
ncbi:N-formylglutamate deformylase [Pigmentiphaga aceris]|uniref:N-formylglutamate deformylase n=1 Tax=Pigmentiphaga aceris TaxID=1940612 RepID=A0A5C0ARM2_9BURK|nr:N-formylglutamate deformylase [Pigmentiphaga aceris]QEI04748.1 N-formylglutamate deformylase [Pigmentiphaga aceris]